MLTKSIGTHNPHNVVKATIDALEQLRDKRYAVARELRGPGAWRKLLTWPEGDDQDQADPQPDLHAGKAQARCARARAAAR